MTSAKDETVADRTNLRQISVTGRLSIQETRRPIPGLLVEIVQSGDRPMRLDTVVTGRNGDFASTLDLGVGEDAAYPETLSLGLRVLAPSRVGSDTSGAVLFDAATRLTAAKREVYLIELPSAVLKDAGLDHVLGDTSTQSDRQVKAIEETVTASLGVAEAASKVLAARVARKETDRQFLRDTVIPKIAHEISTVSQEQATDPRFVADVGKIEATGRAVAREELKRWRKKSKRGAKALNDVTRSTRLQLDQKVLEALRHDSADDEAVIVMKSDVEAALGVPMNKPSLLERGEDADDICRDKLPGEVCLDGSKDASSSDPNDRDPSNGGSGTNADGDAAGRNVAFTAGTAIARLMDGPAIAMQDGSAELEPRLASEDVERAIGGVTLLPGPADVPAFHDFTTLQLAFEDVWQEALDDRVFRDVEDAYDRIVNSGLPIDPAAPWNIDYIIGVLAGIEEANNDVPDEVSAQIRISRAEYGVLSPGAQSRLLALAGQMGVTRTALIDALTPAVPEENESSGGGGSNNPFIPDFIEDEVERLLETGVDLITAPSRALVNLVRSQLGQVGAAYDTTAIKLLEQLRILESEADKIVAFARQTVLEQRAATPLQIRNNIIHRLGSARANNISTTHFAASPSQRSVNFGLMLTYRQKWTPVSYQVGDLVSTLPLGPGQKMSFTKKESKKTRRLEKELEKNLSDSKFSTESKSRAEAEILAKAVGKTNFTHTMEGTYDFGVGPKGKNTTTFTADAEKHSSDTKKSMREAVLKASEERRRETKIEVETERTDGMESSEKNEIFNPNDEIPVTFLFYELQRRFRINEKLHRMQSVVLVAQEMPRASQIDVVWIIQHDWILNRVLLDDSFRAALRYASTTLVGEREMLDHMNRALIEQERLVEQIREDLADRRSSAGLRYAALERQIERTANDADGTLWDDVTDYIKGGGLLGGVLGGGQDGEDNAAKIRESAARDAWDRERREEESYRNRLMGAQSTLAEMRSSYQKKLAKHLGELTQVERLATHITQNIMHYMQAIWSHEPEDQRFLRLRNVPVPDLQPRLFNHRFEVPADLQVDLIDNTVGVISDYGIGTLPPQPENIPTVPLAKVADINNPMGFMGNYAIFPLYEVNALTDFMMEPYVAFAAGEYGIRDPDPAGNMSLEEFSDYICCLHKHLDEAEFKKRAPALERRLKELLSSSLRENEEIVVGTGNLYIECLPGVHSVMEQFKHLHRRIDVQAAGEDLRAAALDNVRRAQRIIDNNLEDPDIDTKYLFEGGGSATVVPPGGGSE